MQRPGHRDENLVQDTPGGPVRIRAAGAGRDLIAYGDVVTGRPAHELASIATWPAIEQSPHPEDPVDEREHRPMPGQAE